MPQSERTDDGENGDPAVRVLEGEQERDREDGFAHIRAVHYGEVGVYVTPNHTEYMEKHRQVQARREAESKQESPAAQPPFWREVIAGVCRASHFFVLAFVRDVTRHPEQFSNHINAQMQRVS